ncbi:hypothetical protein [Nocardia tengchongensis]|uniref:hypothetical protein n=1 Tax=Nocardia tengchongensis TaxID=2055889 RepID=UPI003619B8B7
MAPHFTTAGGGEDPMSRLAELHLLCTPIHRLHGLLAIADELRERYPDLGPMLTEMRWRRRRDPHRRRHPQRTGRA